MISCLSSKPMLEGWKIIILNKKKLSHYNLANLIPRGRPTTPVRLNGRGAILLPFPRFQPDCLILLFLDRFCVSVFLSCASGARAAAAQVPKAWSTPRNCAGQTIAYPDRSGEHARSGFDSKVPQALTTAFSKFSFCSVKSWIS